MITFQRNFNVMSQSFIDCCLLIAFNQLFCSILKFIKDIYLSLADHYYNILIKKNGVFCINPVKRKRVLKRELKQLATNNFETVKYTIINFMIIIINEKNKKIYEILPNIEYVINIFQSLNLMIPHKNTNLLEIIQAEVSEVEKQFIKWRLTMGQLSKSSNLKLSQLGEAITIKLDSIHFYACQFCLKIQNDIKEVNNKISQIQNSPPTSLGTNQKSNWNQQEQYFIVTKKITNLEQSLRHTQENERKLINSINELMKKYHISEQPSFIKNDHYLNSHIQCSRIAEPAIFQSHGPPTINILSSPFANSVSKSELMAKQKESKRLLLEVGRPERGINFQCSRTQPQYIRTFSNHMSSKATQNNPQNQINFPSYDLMKINQGEDDLIHMQNSTYFEQSEHRINFLMQNLTK